MTIAGVKPEFNVLAPKDALIPVGEYYTAGSVREILIKFIHGLEPDDLDSIGFMYGHNLNDKAKSMEVGIVDEFMKGNGEEYDNFSSEDTTYVEAVEAAQLHLESVIKGLKRKYGEDD
jgi:hypothetical protein